MLDAPVFHGQKEALMARVTIDTPAPDFTLDDFEGNVVTLSDFREKAHVLLVFNRGFV
jgi:peroxiredoxin